MGLLRGRPPPIPAGRPLWPRDRDHRGGIAARIQKSIARFVRRRRRVKPTREGWVFLGAALAVALAALNTGNNLLYLVFATMLSMVALSGVLSELSVQQVAVSRRIRERVFARSPARGAWVLHNPRRVLSNLALSLREVPGRDARMLDEAPVTFTVLSAGGREQRQATWRFAHRGVHRLAAVRVATTWPFGIFEKWYELPAPMEVLVHPQPLPGGRAQSLGDPAQGEQAPGGRRGGGELLGLRDHRSGEDPRQIHWRTSARLGRRIAVDRADERGGRVLVTVPTTTGPEAGDAFELALSMATGAVLTALEDGRRVVLDLPDRRLEGSSEDTDLLLRALALAELPGRA